MLPQIYSPLPWQETETIDSPSPVPPSPSPFYSPRGGEYMEGEGEDLMCLSVQISHGAAEPHYIIYI